MLAIKWSAGEVQEVNLTNPLHTVFGTAPLAIV